MTTLHTSTDTAWPDSDIGIAQACNAPLRQSTARGIENDSGSSPDRTAFQSALAEWSEILGPAHVLADDETRRQYSRTSLPEGTRPCAVLRPASVDEVRRVVQVASRFAIPLYPISRGKNLGYGDACAVTDGQAILDLARMNRILEVNVPLAYAVIEPGVSQQQLYEYLRDNNLPLLSDVTGAGPEASIVGNILERGFGHTPYGDRFRHTSGMEVVLADGSLLHTGFGGFENAQATYCFPAGIGPSIDGLFTQSNFGIVTKLGLWLMPRPERIVGFAFKVAHDEALGDVVEALRELRLNEIIRSTVHVANDLRVISSRMSYPWDLADEVTPLPSKIRQHLRDSMGIGAWNCIGGLYGTLETVAAAIKVIRRTMRRVARVQFFGERKLRWTKRCLIPLQTTSIGRRLSNAIASAESVYGLLQGIPDNSFLQGIHWRSRPGAQSASSHPACGLMWLAPVLPMTAVAAREALALVTPVYQAYGFELMATMTSVTARALCCVLSLSYDRTDVAETRRAKDCYKTCLDILLEHGYIPYRTGIQSMSTLCDPSSTYWQMVARIKASFDPDNLLAPHRYQPA